MKKFLMICALLALFGCEHPDKDGQAPSAAQDQDQKAVFTLGIGADAFIANFNSKPSDYKISAPSMTLNKDGYLTFTHKFNPQIAIICVINPKDRSLRSVTMINAIGGDTPADKFKSALSVPVLAAVSMQAISPAVSKETIGKIATSLFEKATDNSDLMQTDILNGNRYSLTHNTEFNSYIFSATSDSMPQENN